MRLIVDTYNVLHQWHSGPTEPGRDVAALAVLISQSRYGGGGCVLVCDGVRPPQLSQDTTTWPRRVRVIYSGSGREADDVIERLIAEHTFPRGLTVASSDRRVQTAATRRGAAALTSQDFLGQIIRDAASGVRPEVVDDPEEPKVDADRWLDEFDVPTELLELSIEEAPRSTAPSPTPPPPKPSPSPEPARDESSDDQLIRDALEGRERKTSESAEDSINMEDVLRENPPGGKPKRPKGRGR